jgi:hypothetical protein
MKTSLVRLFCAIGGSAFDYVREGKQTLDCSMLWASVCRALMFDETLSFADSLYDSSSLMRMLLITINSLTANGLY